MTVCSNCGNEVQDTAVFCDQCGTRLKESAPQAAEQAAPAPVEVKPVEATVPVPDQSVRCAACGYPNAPGELFCENCGVALEALEPEEPDALRQAQDDAASEAEPEATVPAAVDTVLGYEPTCPACGATVSPDDKFCDNCGAELAAAAETPASPAAQLEPTKTPAAPVTGGPVLVVADSGAEISLPAGDEIVIGREDPVSSIFPDVDLTPHGGEEGGVSREHAKIQVQNGNYSVQDLDSTNFTFLNRKRLAAHAPEPLQDGDELRLGRVRLLFKAG